MMGPKTPKEIRAGIRQALAETGEDPIEWLERRMSAPLKAPNRNGRRVDVAASLLRLLKSAPKAKPGRNRAKAKK